MSEIPHEQAIRELRADVDEIKRQCIDVLCDLGQVPVEIRPLVKEKIAAGFDLKTAVEAVRRLVEGDAAPTGPSA